jgi:hypothetical protein
MKIGRVVFGGSRFILFFVMMLGFDMEVRDAVEYLLGLHDGVITGVFGALRSG